MKIKTSLYFLFAFLFFSSLGLAVNPPGDGGVSDITTDSITFYWGANGNSGDTSYRIYLYECEGGECANCPSGEYCYNNEVYRSDFISETILTISGPEFDFNSQDLYYFQVESFDSSGSSGRISVNDGKSFTVLSYPPSEIKLGNPGSDACFKGLEYQCSSDEICYIEPSENPGEGRCVNSNEYVEELNSTLNPETSTNQCGLIDNELYFCDPTETGPNNEPLVCDFRYDTHGECVEVRDNYLQCNGVSMYDTCGEAYTVKEGIPFSPRCVTSNDQIYKIELESSCNLVWTAKSAELRDSNIFLSATWDENVCGSSIDCSGGQSLAGTGYGRVCSSPGELDPGTYYAYVDNIQNRNYEILAFCDVSLSTDVSNGIIDDITGALSGFTGMFTSMFL